MPDNNEAGERVRIALAGVRDLFQAQFDVTWLHTAVDGLTMQSTIFQQIRESLADARTFETDPGEAVRRLDVLEAFVADLRHQLLPVLRERLGISGLRPRHSGRGRFIMQEMVAYTFPHNLKQLEENCAALRATLTATGPQVREETLPEA